MLQAKIADMNTNDAELDRFFGDSEHSFPEVNQQSWLSFTRSIVKKYSGIIREEKEQRSIQQIMIMLFEKYLMRKYSMIMEMKLGD